MKTSLPVISSLTDVNELIRVIDDLDEYVEERRENVDSEQRQEEIGGSDHLQEERNRLTENTKAVIKKSDLISLQKHNEYLSSVIKETNIELL